MPGTESWPPELAFQGVKAGDNPVNRYICSTSHGGKVREMGDHSRGVGLLLHADT